MGDVVVISDLYIEGDVGEMRYLRRLGLGYSGVEVRRVGLEVIRGLAQQRPEAHACQLARVHSERVDGALTGGPIGEQDSFDGGPRQDGLTGERAMADLPPPAVCETAKFRKRLQDVENQHVTVCES
jgi:hypothetical protein